MNVDFFAQVNKSSETPFNSSGSAESAAPGFREQLNRAMRDNDRKNESPVEKKSAERKKASVAEQPRNSAKAGEKAAAPKNDRSGRKSAAGETGDVKQKQVHEEESSEAACPFVLAVEDSGFPGELEEAETSETESIYTFAPAPDKTSETENDYTFAPKPAETSETENAYASEPDEFADSAVSSSTDAQFFPPVLIKDDSGFAAMMNMEAAAKKAVSGTDLNTAPNWNADSEAVSATITGRTVSAPPPETPEAGIAQNASFSENDTINGAKEFSEAMAGEMEPAAAESARPAVEELLEDGFFPKNPPLTQNAGRNAQEAPLRGEAARGESFSAHKTSENAELTEILKQAADSASSVSSEDDDLLLERIAAQALRPREATVFTKSSEISGKTVQVAETSINATSAAVKSEAPAQARSVNASDQEFIVELAGRIQSQIRGGREMIRIQLHPEELGHLEIRAESGRNGIIARIAAQSLDAKKLLESNLQGLQQTLEARGLKIDRLHIVVDESADAALFADGGRYGQAGAGPRNSEVSEFSTFTGTVIETPQEEESDLSAEASRRNAGFYTVG